MEDKDKTFAELDKYIEIHRENREKSMEFVEYLYKLMDKYKMEKASEIYKTANITKQCWSGIISGKSIPSLNTCIRIALAMKLTNHECKYLLKKAGYTLSSANEFGLVIRFCFEKGIYDIYDVSELLESRGIYDFS